MRRKHPPLELIKEEDHQNSHLSVSHSRDLQTSHLQQSTSSSTSQPNILQPTPLRSYRAHISSSFEEARRYHARSPPIKKTVKRFLPAQQPPFYHIPQLRQMMDRMAGSEYGRQMKGVREYEMIQKQMGCTARGRDLDWLPLQVRLKEQNRLQILDQLKAKLQMKKKQANLWSHHHHHLY